MARLQWSLLTVPLETPTWAGGASLSEDDEGDRSDDSEASFRARKKKVESEYCFYRRSRLMLDMLPGGVAGRRHKLIPDVLLRGKPIKKKKAKKPGALHSKLRKSCKQLSKKCKKLPNPPPNPLFTSSRRRGLKTRLSAKMMST